MECGTWVMCLEMDSNRDISKMGQDEPRWGQVVVYPNVSATVLAQVTVEGKAVSSGSVVGAFVGDELRGQHGGCAGLMAGVMSRST